MNRELWNYRTDLMDRTENLAGFAVEATDGGIGHIDEASSETGAGYIVVDTGPWIFGKKVMIPAGAISNVDLDEQRVDLSLTRDQVKNSPMLDDGTQVDDDYRHLLGSYYETIPPR